MILITSPDNEKIKAATLLRDSAAQRRSSGLCFVEGLRLCADAAASGRLRCVFVTEESANAEPEKIDGICAASESFLITERVAKKLSDTQNPQGIFALCDTSGLLRDAQDIPAGRYIAAERVCDPGNLGTIIRTAEALGADGMILSAGCADAFSPKVLRASMGGALRLPLYSAQELSAVLAGLSENGFECLAAMAHSAAADVRQVKPVGSFVLVIGNEAVGITPETGAVCSAVTIPMSGGAESLNAASAASILLWELFGRA